MSSVTFYKICELLLVVIYAFGADYMMTSVLGRRFVPKRKIPFFNFQRLAYILTLATTFLFLSHENTAYTTVYKLVMQFAIVIFMYKGKFALRVLMGAAHFFTLFIGEFLSLNAIYALGIPIERLYVKFSFWVLMCDLLSSLLVFIVGFVAHRIREFPTKSLSSKQLLFKEAAFIQQFKQNNTADNFTAYYIKLFDFVRTRRKQRKPAQHQRECKPLNRKDFRLASRFENISAAQQRGCVIVNRPCNNCV